MRPCRIAWPAAALVLALCSVASAAPLPADTTAILSGSSSLTTPLSTLGAGSSAGPQALSTDGRFVAFTSASDGLSSADDDGVTNVYVEDRATNTVTLASRRTGANGASADQDCGSPALSDNGQRVAFVCDGPLEADDTNGQADVYVRDLPSNTTILVSRAAGATGAVGSSSSFSPSINGDGTIVAFGSNSSNLITGSGGFQHVFRRVLTTDALELVDRANTATGAVGDSFGQEPSISNDGNLVAFSSSATNLLGTGAGADTNGQQDVFVRNMSAETVQLVSRQDGTTGTLSNGRSGGPAMSGNGAFVAFTSQATNLSANDVHTDQNIYLRSLTSNATNLLDQIDDTEATGGSGEITIDDSGNNVGFLTSSGIFDPTHDTGGYPDIYVSTNAAAVSLVSRPTGADSQAADTFEGQPSISGDGTKVLVNPTGSITGEALPGIGTLALRDRTANTTSPVVAPTGGSPFNNLGGSTGPVALSADGRYAAFVSGAPAFGVPGNLFGAVVVRDTVTGAVTLASRADGPAGALLSGQLLDVTISADGRRVAFVQHGVTGADALWVRDLDANTTVLASRANGPAGAPGNGSLGGLRGPAISADGRHVAFVTTSSNLADGDADTQADVHERDLVTGTTVLVSRADGLTGAKENAGAQDLSISADGNRVAFDSQATNLGDGTVTGGFHVHVRDIAAGTTKLVDVTPAGSGSNQSAQLPSISGDGGRVAFVSSSSDLVSPPGNTQAGIWVHDFATGANVLASRADGTDSTLPDAVADGYISADGTSVAFTAVGALVPGVPSGATEVYRRTLATGTTRLVSRASGAGGAPAPFGPAGNFLFTFPNGSSASAISADGSCVAFLSDGDLLGPPGSADFSQGYLRAFTTDCGRPQPAPPPGGSGAGPGAPGVTIAALAPALTHVSLLRARFRDGPSSTATVAKAKKRTPVGTAFRYTVNVAATVTIRIDRLTSGRRVGKLCLSATHARRHRTACTRTTKIATLTRHSTAGTHSVAFSGRIGKRKLAAGRYHATLIATDASKRASKSVVLAFTVVTK